MHKSISPYTPTTARHPASQQALRPKATTPSSNGRPNRLRRHINRLRYQDIQQLAFRPLTAAHGLDDAPGASKLVADSHDAVVGDCAGDVVVEFKGIFDGEEVAMADLFLRFPTCQSRGVATSTLSVQRFLGILPR